MIPTRTLLNIGLTRNDGKGENSVDLVIGVLIGLGMDPKNAVLHDPFTEAIPVGVTRDPFKETITHMLRESTLIVEVGLGSIYNRAHEACTYLAQDCVAMHVPDHKIWDELIGPKSHEWGPFDPAKFILPNGTTLAQDRAKKILASAA